MSIFDALGWVFQKPTAEVHVPEDIQAEFDETIKERRTIAKSNSELLAEKMDGVYMNKEALLRISSAHDFTNPLWGSRRAARVFNYASNILDMEIVNGRAEEEDRIACTMLIAYLSFFHVMPVKDVLRVKDVDAKYTKIFTDIIKESALAERTTVSQGTIDMLCLGALSWEKTIPGDNMVLDIFHDACRLDGVFFGQDAHMDVMRTELAKNESFRSWTKKVSINNSSPTWLIYLQRRIDGCVFIADENEEFSRNETNESDGFV